MENSFHIDSSVWAEKINKWSQSRIEIEYKEYERETDGETKKFPVLYVKGIKSIFAVPKSDGVYTLQSGEKKIAFYSGKIYTRVNSASVPAQGEKISRLLYAIISRAKSKEDVSSLSLETINALKNKSEPSKITEPIWSNLFPVTEIPDIIYSAHTGIRTPKELFDELNKHFIDEGYYPPEYPGFVLKEGKMFSFEKLDNPENTLSVLNFSNVTSEKTSDWINDKKKARYLIELLNRLLKNVCRKRGFRYDFKRQRFFSYFDGENIPVRRWKPAKRETSRHLVYKRRKENVRFFEHFGGRLRFVLLGTYIYLVVDPMRVLTMDGITPVDQKSSTRFHTKRNTQYHNNNYLYDVKFWLFLLSRNLDEIIFNMLNPVKVSVKSLKMDSPKGISEDHNVDDDFLDQLKSTPLEYEAFGESLPENEENPLTDPPLED